MTEWYRAGRRSHGNSYRPGWSRLPGNQPVSPRQLQAAASRTKPEGVCQDCERRVERRSHMGPYPKRCPDCSVARKATRDRLRKRGKLEDNRPHKPKGQIAKLHVPPCCQDAPGRTCEQHKQARRFEYDTARQATDRDMVNRLFATLGDGFTVN